MTSSPLHISPLASRRTRMYCLLSPTSVVRGARLASWRGCAPRGGAVLLYVKRRDTTHLLVGCFNDVSMDCMRSRDSSCIDTTGTGANATGRRQRLAWPTLAASQPYHGTMVGPHPAPRGLQYHGIDTPSVGLIVPQEFRNRSFHHPASDWRMLSLRVSM